ncbi:hypothetical protein K439DRAFT_1621432 [Ramaria rubella]|nr:hypothetical protein K439DRAFT_1621432 [Ramaria rubella]
MTLEDARRFAMKQGIDPGPHRILNDSILCNKLNFWLRTQKRCNVRAVGMDVMKGGIPVYHVLWISRKLRGPPEICVYDEVPKDVTVKEWLASEGFPGVGFKAWVGATMEPEYTIPEIVPLGPGKS